MARLASESKAGFYATPNEEMEHILQALHLSEESTEEDSYFLFDPCCGEGVALHMMAEAIRRLGGNPFTYGSEIEACRVVEARELLDNVLHEGYQNVRTEPRFSLLWLNPPYQEDTDGKRTELKFLKALTAPKTGVLQKGGLLFFCVPQHVLEPTAGIISGRFKDISVYRFTDENYDVFKQVVVIARYDRAPRKEQNAAFRALEAIGKGTKEMLPTLDTLEPFYVPAADSKEPLMFRARPDDPEEIARDMKTSPLFGEITKRFKPSNSAVTMKRPMLPLKAAHMGTAIAAGAVGGNMGNHSARCS